MEVLEQARSHFEAKYGAKPAIAAYAPGRVEILGNHTDYNEGFVLSCAINAGTFFLLSPSGSEQVRLTAADVDETVESSLHDLRPGEENKWANYVKGVAASVRDLAADAQGFNGLFLGDVPVGSGLSSSAALEISTALAVAKLWNVDISPIETARIGQKAEHEYAGAKCGLLDQISSLYGTQGQLVMTDFRTLEVKNPPFSNDCAFLAFHTHAKHALVDGAYNERRESCEAAAKFFDSRLERPVAALRDVTMKEWQDLSAEMEPIHAKRSAHVIGENERVIKGIEALNEGRFEDFGALMYQSHESSQTNFENSCEELDLIVDTSRNVPGVMGARLSGGGFGGSVISLVNCRDVETVGQAVSSAYEKKYGQKCGVQLLKPSAGASIIS